jgi:uncharacterized integral membrane protein (TIGR00697 family)
MDDQIIYPAIQWLQQYCNAAHYTLLYLIFSGILLLFSHRLFGLFGLYLFNAMSLLAANIQVLGLTSISWFPEPIALGIVTATVTFLGSDIITEHYGVKKAQFGIFISLFVQITFILLMIGGMGYTHLNAEVESSIQILFIPGPRLLTASIIAYGISQYFDIHLFKLIKQWCQQRYLWIRALGSMTISGSIDTLIFSFLAWIVFNPHPITVKQMFLSYILVGYLMRILVQTLAVPIIYLSYYTKPQHELLSFTPANRKPVSPVADTMCKTKSIPTTTPLKFL